MTMTTSVFMAFLEENLEVLFEATTIHRHFQKLEKVSKFEKLVPHNLFEVVVFSVRSLKKKKKTQKLLGG